MGYFYDILYTFFLVGILGSVLFEIWYDFNQLIIPISIFLLLVLIALNFRFYFLEDTLIDSPHFSIDRSRTFNFTLFVYSFGLLSSIAFFIFLPVLPFFLLILLIGAGLGLINLVILIISLVTLVVSGRSLEFLPFDNALQIPLNIYESIELNQSIGDLSISTIYAYISIILGVFVINIWLGKYIEDSKTGIIINQTTFAILGLLVSILSIESLRNYYHETFGNLFSVDQIIILLITMLILSIFISKYFYNKKEAQSDFRLLDFPGYLRIVLILLGFALIIYIIFDLSRYLHLYIPLFYDLNLLQQIASLLGISTVILTFIYIQLKGIRGDFPIDFKIEETELREKLQTGELQPGEYY